MNSAMYKVLYIRDRYGKNRGTVVYNVHAKNDGVIRFAVSACNQKDNFSKSEGIAIAEQRLINNPHLVMVKPGALNNEIVKSILTRVSRDAEFTASIRKLSRKMLKMYKSTQ